MIFVNPTIWSTHVYIGKNYFHLINNQNKILWNALCFMFWTRNLFVYFPILQLDAYVLYGLDHVLYLQSTCSNFWCQNNQSHWELGADVDRFTFYRCGKEQRYDSITYNKKEAKELVTTMQTNRIKNWN